MVGILVTCALVGGVAPEASYTEENIEVLTRRYRIQAYYQFHGERGEFDQRLLTGKILEFELKELNEGKRQEVAAWFHDAIVRGESGEPELPGVPVAVDEIQLATRQLEQGIRPDTVFQQYLATSNRSFLHPELEAYATDEPDLNRSTETVEVTSTSPADTSSTNDDGTEASTAPKMILNDTTFDNVSDNQVSSDETAAPSNALPDFDSPQRQGSVFGALKRIIVRRALGGTSNNVEANSLPYGFVEDELEAEIDEEPWESDSEEESDEEYDVPLLD